MLLVSIFSAQIAWEGAKADGHHNAHHSLCAWHKIHMGLLSLRLGSFPMPDIAKETMDDVKKWLNWFCTRSSILLAHPEKSFTTSLSLIQLLFRMEDVRLSNMDWKREGISKNMSLHLIFATSVEREHHGQF